MRIRRPWVEDQALLSVSRAQMRSGPNTFTHLLNSGSGTYNPGAQYRHTSSGMLSRQCFRYSSVFSSGGSRQARRPTSQEGLSCLMTWCRVFNSR